MAQIGNRRFPKVFVVDPSTELTTIAASPNDLTLFQVGFFNSKTLAGATAIPAPTVVPTIEVHQNLGDNRYGTVRSKQISAQQVRRWHASKASVAVAQVLYIGYDEVVGTKTLTAYVGQLIGINLTIFDNELKKWYGEVGYTERLTFDAANCAPCIADCTLIDPDVIADYFVARINGTDALGTNFPVTMELTNWVTATKVAIGTQGAVDRRVGIKLVVKAQAIETLAVCNTQQFYKTNLTTIAAGVGLNCPNFPVTTTVKAKSGSGYPMEVAELEIESQGYDRVRDVFEEVKFMRNNYILRANNALKYDFYYLEFDAVHQLMGKPQELHEPHILIFPVPTGTGAALEAFFNAWLTPLGFTAVAVAAGTAKGSGVQQVNA